MNWLFLNTTKINFVLMEQNFGKKSHQLFILYFSIIWLILLILCLTFTKLELHSILNSFHNPIFDFFFKYITHLGDGIFAIVLVIVFFTLNNKKLSIYLLISFILTSILVQGLKSFVFSDSMRPFFYIDQGLLNVAIVDQVAMHKQFSFPSGHSTTVFAVATLLSLFYQSSRIAIFLVIISCLTAFSRVYLSQHFIQDVLAGSFFGIVSSLLVYYNLEKLNLNQLNNSTK